MEQASVRGHNRPEGHNESLVIARSGESEPSISMETNKPAQLILPPIAGAQHAPGGYPTSPTMSSITVPSHASASYLASAPGSGLRQAELPDASQSSLYELSPDAQLRAASSRGNLARVQELLEAHANPNSTAGSGNTALHLVARFAGGAIQQDSYLNIGIALLKARALVDGCFVRENSALTLRTPLMEACARGAPKIARLLLEHSADHNRRDHFGNSCMELACNGLPGGAETVFLLQGFR